jgi:putative ATPase
MTLFDQHRQRLTELEAPLAARMRPRTLDEFVGQDAILGPGRLLRRAIQADQLSSLIFYGPPGTGKTTLAQIIANTTRAQFIPLNAVLAGVKDIREAIATAQDHRGMQGQRTILFVDEVHRFNKAQQDALLPWVENGTVILIGATTENPYFEVNKALVSRSRLFQLKPLTDENLRQVVRRVLTDGDRGYGGLTVDLAPEALEHLINVANGDARALLNALELAVETTPPHPDGKVVISLAVAEESIQQRAVLYDKEGDAHFDTISAFIKSVRGSDPDAALYWLARMIYAGEDPRFILRRLLILASEDVGLADPQAIAIVNACAQAFDRVGMPEGRYPLAQATLYLATAPKSNSVMGFFDALATVERDREGEIPNPLKDANRDKHGLGHGSGYLYPHAYRDHWVEQQYLPPSLQGQVFYQPSAQGYEGQIQAQVARQREAQLAALLERSSPEGLEILTVSPEQPAVDRWLQRTLSQQGQQLAQVRDRLFTMHPIQPHHVLLDLYGKSGLFTWEAVRRVPEGGVYTWADTAETAAALTEQAAALPELRRPIILRSQALAPEKFSWVHLPQVLVAQDPQLRFDVLLGYNALMQNSDRAAWVQSLLPWLQPGGAILLAETLPRHTQRLYALVGDRLKSRLYKRLVQAEEAIYANPEDPMVNWDEQDLETLLPQDIAISTVTVERSVLLVQVTAPHLARWFPAQATSPQARPSYAEQLAQRLSADELEQIRRVFHATLTDQTVEWRRAIAYLKITPTAQSQ